MLSGVGGFTVNAGAGPFTISAPVALSNTSAWINNSANTMLVSGPISGAGALAYSGTGILILSASNTYSGGTTINSGVVKLSGAASSLGLSNNALALDWFDQRICRSGSEFGQHRSGILERNGHGS